MSLKKIYFTPGPSQTYFTMDSHLKKALDDQVPSISHRGAAFQKIFQEAVENLKGLMGIPSGYQVFFTSSATEIWERSIQNCVERESFHLVNGAFSARFAKIASNLGRKATLAQVPEGQCVDINGLLVPESCELIAITQNETSTGAAQPLADVAVIREAFQDQLIALDVVSSLPYIDLDFHQVDMAYCSVQKCFGLPAGLGIWIVNERCMEKARALLNKGQSIGSYHCLPELADKAAKHQTPETPNVLGIYLLAKVAGDMLAKGVTQIRRETDYKAAVIYNLLQKHPKLSPFVDQEKYRSKTTIVARVDYGEARDFIDPLEQKGLVVGTGYGSFKREHIRIANFPTHSKEQTEMLVDLLEDL